MKKQRRRELDVDQIGEQGRSLTKREELAISEHIRSKKASRVKRIDGIMKMKESKAQLEVWAAKERLAEELLKLPPNERTAYIIRKTQKTVDSLKRNRQKKK